MKKGIRISILDAEKYQHAKAVYLKVNIKWQVLKMEKGIIHPIVPQQLRNIHEANAAKLRWRTSCATNILLVFDRNQVICRCSSIAHFKALICKYLPSYVSPIWVLCRNSLSQPLS